MVLISFSVEDALPRDEVYYLKNIVFLVEGYLFQVPRCYLEGKSKTFDAMFAQLAQEEESHCYNESDPIELHNITHDEFQSLLKVVYPLEAVVLDKEEWKMVLKLSTMWMFNDARARAIEKLSDQSDMEIIDRIFFAREYKVGSWLVEAYNTLAKRPEPMSLNDGASLGWDVVFSMCIVRDQFDRSGRSGVYHRNDYDFRSIIRGTFQEELAGVAVLDEHPVLWSHEIVKDEHEVKQDEKYYLESVVFRVQDRIFKVPRLCFEKESEIFGSTFLVPAETKQGCNDENPFLLGEVNESDFRNLLKIIYPLHERGWNSSNGPMSIDQIVMSRSEWTSVLRLSTMWMFASVRLHAIKMITLFLPEISAIEKIELGRSYNVRRWLAGGYTELAKRDKPISGEEVKRLVSDRGYDAVLNIFKAREQFTPQACYIGGTWGHSRCDAAIIEQVFREELDSAGFHEQVHGDVPKQDEAGTMMGEASASVVGASRTAVDEAVVERSESSLKGKGKKKGKK